MWASTCMKTRSQLPEIQKIECWAEGRASLKALKWKLKAIPATFLSLALHIPLSSRQHNNTKGIPNGSQIYYSQSCVIGPPPAFFPPGLPSSVNGITMHPVAAAPNLGIFFKSLFFHLLCLIQQQVQLLYPQNILNTHTLHSLLHHPVQAAIPPHLLFWIIKETPKRYPIAAPPLPQPTVN